MHVRPMTVVDRDVGLAGGYGEQLVHQLALLVDGLGAEAQGEVGGPFEQPLPLVGSGIRIGNAACAQHRRNVVHLTRSSQVGQVCGQQSRFPTVMVELHKTMTAQWGLAGPDGPHESDAPETRMPPEPGVNGAHGNSVAGAAGLVLAQVTSLQLGSAVAKDLFGRAGPSGIAGLRIAWTALVLCALVRPRLRGLSTRQLTAAFGLGFVVAAMNLTYFHAIARIPIGVASSLELLGPLGLSLVMSRRPIDLLWSGLSAVGLSLLAIPSSELNVAGLGFGAIAGLLRAGYVLLNRRVGELFDDWSGLALALTAGAVVLTPIGVITGGEQLTHCDVLIHGLGVAILSSLVPYSLDLLTLRRITPRLFGIFLSASPAVAAMIGYVVLGESIIINDLLAIGLITAANIAAVRAHRRAAVRPGDHQIG
jgi:inner membrane transporter RhtA